MFRHNMNINEKRRIRSIIECLLSAGAVIVMLFILFGYTGNIVNSQRDYLTKISDGWYYYDGTKKVPIELPASISSEDSITVYNDSLTKEIAGKTVSMKGVQNNPIVMINEEEIYRYEEFDFQRNDQMKGKLFCDVRIPIDFEKGTFSICLSETGKIFEIPEIYVGSSEEVFRQHVMDDFVSMCLIFVMFVVSIFAFGLRVYLHFKHIEERRFFYAGLFTLLCAIWCLTDSYIMHDAMRMHPAVCLVSFYAFMLMSVPMIHFIQDTGDIKKNKSIDVLILLFYINAIGQGILNYLHVFTFIQMLFVTHILLALGVVMLCVLLVKEYRNNKGLEISAILLAFLVLGLSGVLAIILYWILEIPYYSIIFELGILLFVILLISSTVINIVDNFRFRMEAEVYRRLAKEDRLTGLGNRRAFEEMINFIQTKADQYKDVLLIFMDLNRLKAINDRHGHSAGDETIIAASVCIESAFGDCGSCFRIGGDEFCSIIIEPKDEIEKWFERLDHEIYKYVRNGKYELSIARGHAYLRDENGNVKTVSDWKYEADLSMYENKGRGDRYDEL